MLRREDLLYHLLVPLSGKPSAAGGKNPKRKNAKREEYKPKTLT